ncbi:MAG: cell division protein ZapE [Alphaproteobacteria bacterium]|nr:cell division protein ZapE [Alphaproteobacteria bacterium]MCZ6764775.1 cell division protein ZapE [Alphaproteobacteria bacterium]
MTDMPTYRQTDGPAVRFHTLVEAGELTPDPGQRAAVERLQALDEALGTQAPRNLLARLRGFVGNGAAREIKGLYMHGPVGRGKSMLMDLFFDQAAATKKRRVHFHAFMLEVQERLKSYRAARTRDPLAALAREIAGETSLLCFDEFHVVNIADAMILGRFFETVLDAGTVIVATSNVAPDDLYKGGLQRRNFLPFIEMIKQHMDVVDIGEGDDHRRHGLVGAEVYFTPLGAPATAALDRLYEDMTRGGPPGGARVLEVQGRILEIPRQRGGVARFVFAELCQRPLGAADYLALAAHFHCLVLDAIPRMTPADRSAAKRFVVLIDALYEHKVKLVCAADARPDALYPEGDTALEFLRTASRLIEMQTRTYLGLPHAPPGEQPPEQSSPESV